MRLVPSLLAAVPCCLAVVAAPATAATLYVNDFGTATQYAGYRVTVAGNGGVEFRTAPQYPDLDGDGQSQLLLYNNASNGRAYLDKSFYAPTFTTLSAPKFSAKGSGYRTANNAGAAVEIGVGGTYLASDQTSGNIADSSPVAISTQLSGPAYEKLLSFDTRARMEVLGGSIPAGAGRPRMGSFQVEANINPGQIGDRVWIYKNDFGTAPQLADWTLAGAAITASTAPSPSTPAQDLDGDNLGRGIMGDTTGAFTTTLTKRIDAPDGFHFADPIAQLQAGGDLANWASGVKLFLSSDGVTFSEVVAQTGQGTSLLVADSSAGPSAFDDLASVWVRIELKAGNPNGIRPFAQNLLVSAELAAVPEPASLLLVAAGAAAMLIRRGVKRI